MSLCVTMWHILRSFISAPHIGLVSRWQCALFIYLLTSLLACSFGFAYLSINLLNNESWENWDFKDLNQESELSRPKPRLACQLPTAILVPMLGHTMNELSRLDPVFRIHWVILSCPACIQSIEECCPSMLFSVCLLCEIPMLFLALSARLLLQTLWLLFHDDQNTITS